MSNLLLEKPPLLESTDQAFRRVPLVDEPTAHLHATVLGIWLASLIWFHPRLASLLTIADAWYSWLALAFFVVFVEIAWLYGIFNVCIVGFAAMYRRSRKIYRGASQLLGPQPGVAMLYTTCNDFVEASVHSCLSQNYDNYHIYLLDDSTDPACQARVDRVAADHPDRVTVVRRPDRRGFKAGNLNHGLAEAAVSEKYFVLVDADEILPDSFLRRLVPRIDADPHCGFIQANHRSNPSRRHPLADAVGVGIDIHWRWYQPLRNRYGFVMLLGHGAIIRREAWVKTGGFPEIVSEDLGFALRMREHGWRGYFAEDVICLEDFPETFRAFRIRHMKWTKGTSEFIQKEFVNVLRSKRLTWAEKIDVLLPTLNLPLSMAWFLFLIDANLVLNALFGEWQALTLAVGDAEFVTTTIRLDGAFAAIYSPDFLLITLVTLLAPILCFGVEMWRTPVRLFRFLAKSTAVYASLGPLSFIGVSSYMMTRRATFLVTGDQARKAEGPAAARSLVHRLTHPDHLAVRGFEMAVGISLIVAGVLFFQPASLGLGVAFALAPVLHGVHWSNPWMAKMVFVPIVFIGIGVALAVSSLAGVQTMFMGYGLHF